ncbi:MAG: SpoIIE family protein phosphatase, partial [Bdellovibrio sp.]|nr:SpoIIE family protein phosphatase [Bdellovibrio sp.]
ALRPAYTLIEKGIFLGMVAVGAAVVFAILFSKTLTAPIGRLYEATKQVASGNFGLQVEEQGTDEISALSRSFNVMAKKISELIEESIERTKLEGEIAIASTVQQTLIPPNQYMNEWITIHSRYSPADQCGGDWWGFFGVRNKAVIMIADATGHGLPCALITASARSCFSVLHKLAIEDPDFSFSPAAMLSYANRVVFDASQGSIMMTFFIAVIDGAKGTVTYANAGHFPAWLFRKEVQTNYPY